MKIHGFGHDDQLFRVIGDDGETITEGRVFSLVCESAGLDQDSTDVDYFRCGLTGEWTQYRESTRFDSEHYVIDGKCYTVIDGECFPYTALHTTHEGTFGAFECAANGDEYTWHEV